MSIPQRVLDSIRHVVRLLREGSRASEDQVGLSAAQLFVLQKLADGRPLSLNQLAARTLTHQSSVSVVVRRLVERGLVQRRPAAEDARRLNLSLTKRGQALLSRAPSPAQDRVINAIAALPAPKQRALAEALESLVSALGLDARAAKMLFADELDRRRPRSVAGGARGRRGAPQLPRPRAKRANKRA